MPEDGTVTLHQLPFQAGESIEIIVLSRGTAATPSDRYPLRGTTVRYLEPTKPVAHNDWKANQ